MPSNRMPVEKEPIKKYLIAASLLNKLFLSEPVKIYNGMDKISIPINNMSKLLKEVKILAPQSIKKNKA